MAERRKSRKKRVEDSEPPSKEEYAVAKYLRFNCPAKKTTMMGHKVDYFTASKAVDCLLNSKWAINKGKTEALFTTRESCVNYLDRLLRKQMFHRARKVVKKKVEIKKKKSSEKDDETSGAEERKDKKDKEKKEKNKEEKAKEEKAKEEKVKEEKNKEDKKKGEKNKKEFDGDKGKGENGEENGKKKEKRKIKLEMHEDQIFVDGNEAYVWIYDPVPMRTFVIGLGLVFGAIAICLFPLWPQEVRHIVYYISLAAAGFVGVIIGLAVVRVIVFCFIWTVTLGRHHFWLLPNLTEDVGFIDSFRPLYKYEYRGPSSEKHKNDSKECEETNIDEEEKEKEKDSDKENTDTDRESEDETERKNDENGFEIIEKDDVDQNSTVSK